MHVRTTSVPVPMLLNVHFDSSTSKYSQNTSRPEKKIIQFSSNSINSTWYQEAIACTVCNKSHGSQQNMEHCISNHVIIPDLWRAVPLILVRCSSPLDLPSVLLQRHTQYSFEISDWIFSHHSLTVSSGPLHLAVWVDFPWVLYPLWPVSYIYVPWTWTIYKQEKPGFEIESSCDWRLESTASNQIFHGVDCAGGYFRMKLGHLQNWTRHFTASSTLSCLIVSQTKSCIEKLKFSPNTYFYR